MTAPDLIIREITQDDVRFVISSWIQSYYKGGCAPEVGFDVYKVGQTHLIETFTKTPIKRVMVATPRDIPDEIVGWVSHAAPGILNYIYVKQVYRRLGVARRLAEIWGPVRFHTHETRAGRRFASKLGSRYNPYLINPLTAGLEYP